MRHWTYHGVTFDTREGALTARERSGKSGPPFDSLDVIREWDDERERLDDEGKVVLIPTSPGWFARLRSRLARQAVRAKIVEKVPGLLAQGVVGLGVICLVLVMTLRGCGLRQGERPPVAITLRQPTTVDEAQQQEAIVNDAAHKACAAPTNVVARVLNIHGPDTAVVVVDAGPGWGIKRAVISCKTGKLLGSTTVTTVP